MPRTKVSPAKLLSSKTHQIPGKYLVTEWFFEVPLHHDKPDLEKLQLFGRSVTKFEKPVLPRSDEEALKESQKPWFFYLEGGPGFGNYPPAGNPLSDAITGRGYQLLFLDYRGTGLSSPVSADVLATKGSDDDQALYLRAFRQDTNVLDCEAVRQCLTADYPDEKKKISIFGQSFGGFVSLTYLSFFPDSLRESYLTGGLAPISRTPDEVYRQTYKKVVERNRAYYAKYPEDASAVKAIAQYLDTRDVGLPAGGRLTAARMLTLGIAFGAHGGLDDVHGNVVKMKADLDQFGFLARPTLSRIESASPFDDNVIYAVLHEAIYCYRPGVASNWAAQRVAEELPEFAWADGGSSNPNPDRASDPLFFSGEMVLKAHFETHPELKRLENVAGKLAAYSDWPELYDEEQLAKNEVPVYAASFVDDMYVDFALARETAAKVKNTKVFETNMLYHNALRARSADVLSQLFNLRDDTID